MRRRLEDMLHELVPAAAGAGPTLQRDYWAVLRGCDAPPSGVARLVRERFTQFPPPDLVEFEREEDQAGPLEVGERIAVRIRGAGDTAVIVVHATDTSLTLATVKGHPEAGRITFGAYRNDREDVIFHIRSRARSASRFHRAGFLAAGDPMQTTTWTDFLDRLAHTVGDGVVGSIFVETTRLKEAEDDDVLDEPTFIAEGD